MFEKIIGVIAPHTCLGCELEANRLLCEGCLQDLPAVPSRCYKCKAVTGDYAVCQDCRKYTPLRHVVVATYHRDLAKELIHRTKYERAKQGATEMAAILSQELDHTSFGDGAVITYVPTATSRVRARGYDHARLLAQKLAAGRTAQTLLARKGQAHQVGANRAERIRQLDGVFRPVHVDSIRGKDVLLVDDVLTTGATLESAARELKRAGAKQVDAIVFAQA